MMKTGLRQDDEWWKGVFSEEEARELLKIGRHLITDDEDVITMPITVRRAGWAKLLDGLRDVVSGETSDDGDYAWSWLFGLAQAMVVQYVTDGSWDPDPEMNQFVVYFMEFDDDEEDEDDPDELEG